MNADVIMPVTSANAATYYVSQVALRSCKASTDARIWAYDNNGDGGKYQAQMKTNCEQLGIHYKYVPGPFNMAKIFNMGTNQTKGDYLAYATADVLYFHHWFERIIHHFKKNPEYFCLCNYSYDSENMPCVKHNASMEDRIVPTGNPSSGVLVLRRNDGYVWDEQFPLWEIDSDFLYYMESKGLKAGYCLDARCDHFIMGIRQFINLGTHTDPKESDFGIAKQRVKTKWGERYKGG